jgi:hypothetical protein
MFGRRILGVPIVAVLLLLLSSSDCRIWAAADVQAMRCCARMGCALGQQQRPCFTATAPADGSRTTPQARTSLVAPSVAAELQPPAEELSVVAFSPTGVADATQHSPPELYLLHLSLLI